MNDMCWPPATPWVGRGAKPQTFNPCTESAWSPTGLESFFYSGCSEAACVTYFNVPEHKLYNTIGTVEAINEGTSQPLHLGDFGAVYCFGHQ